MQATWLLQISAVAGFRNLFARQHATHKVTVRGGNFMYAKVTHVSVIFVALQGGSARSGS